MDWFLYDRDLRHERVNIAKPFERKFWERSQYWREKNESNVISQYQSCILGKIWGKVVEMLPYEHE